MPRGTWPRARAGGTRPRCSAVARTSRPPRTAGTHTSTSRSPGPPPSSPHGSRVSLDSSTARPPRAAPCSLGASPRDPTLALDREPPVGHQRGRVGGPDAQPLAPHDLLPLGPPQLLRLASPQPAHVGGQLLRVAPERSSEQALRRPRGLQPP